MPENARTPFLVSPVGVMRSPFLEKFGVPRQAGLVAEAIGWVELFSPYDAAGMLDGLDEFSHLWLVFRFDRIVEQGWRPRVRPPRLGGNEEVGVWASRSPFRPNQLGLSAVRLLEVSPGPPARLQVAGVDLVDGTPIVDIKPYIPYADALPDAHGAFADQPPAVELEVVFSSQAESTLAHSGTRATLRRLIERVIALDPRPAYRRGSADSRVYGMRLAGFDVRWWVRDDDRAEVLELVPVE